MGRAAEVLDVHQEMGCDIIGLQEKRRYGQSSVFKVDMLFTAAVSPVGAGCVGARPGRGGMAQNGETRGGAFHGEMDRCRESQGWTTACSGMSERDGKDQGEDIPKQAGSCWFACPC